MGMGEPLANYEAVWQSIEILNSKHGLGLGARQITISTAGLVPQIRRLAGESIHVELAVSLHAANEVLRNKLVPINKRYPLSQLIPACREYLKKTGRRPTFEYALFQGVNDSLGHARELAHLLEGMNCQVNLIAGNATACKEFTPSPMKRVLAFQKMLKDSGVSSTVRVSKGTDIEAGCGQLRSRLIRT
jgi:23S rRNA (adenine2503-C2)-methyltransferase